METISEPVVFYPRRSTVPNLWLAPPFVILCILIFITTLSGKSIWVAFGSEALFLLLYSQIKFLVSISIDINEKTLVYEYLTIWKSPGSFTIDLTNAKTFYSTGKIGSGEYGRYMTVKDVVTRKKIRLTQNDFLKSQLNEIKRLVELCRS